MNVLDCGAGGPQVVCYNYSLCYRHDSLVLALVGWFLSYMHFSMQPLLTGTFFLCRTVLPPVLQYDNFCFQDHKNDI